MASNASPPTHQGGWRWLVALALPLALVAALVVWWQGGIGLLVGRERCVATSPAGTTSLTPEQAEHAATIAALASRRDLPRRAMTVALSTALQESDLTNLSGGDRDSAGLFQQRPSQGWGSYEQVTDPVYASDRFLSALVEIPRWQTLPVTKAAQAVQRSAFPDAYAQHVERSRILSDVFDGASPASLSCTVRAEPEKAQKEGPSGLTDRAEKVHQEMGVAFGELSLGGFAPGGVTRANPSAHNDGRAIDVFFRPFDDRQMRGEGWRLAHWLVANADRLDVAILIYRDRIWSARRSPEGWRDYTSPFGDPKDPVQRHLDHIHVEVV
jgi:hypothetical protein